MRRRRQQKLEKKLIQFRSKDGGPDTGGTLKIYGEALCTEVPYKTLLLSVHDSAAQVVEEMLEKYGLDRKEAPAFCLVQMTNIHASTSNGTNGGGGGELAQVPREYYLEDEECPLAILMNHPPSRGNNRQCDTEKGLLLFSKLFQVSIDKAIKTFQWLKTIPN